MIGIPPGLAIALQDRYRITRELGQGSMATVYLAEDLKHPGFSRLSETAQRAAPDRAASTAAQRAAS